MTAKASGSKYNSVSRENHRSMLQNLESYICPYCGGNAEPIKGRVRVNHRQLCFRKQWMQQEFPLLMKMIQKGRR